MKQKPLNSKLSEQKLGRGLSALFGEASVNNSLFNNNQKSSPTRKFRPDFINQEPVLKKMN